MHPAISEFPNKEFYANKLTNMVNKEERQPVPWLDWPTPDPVLFLNVG